MASREATIFGRAPKAPLFFSILQQPIGLRRCFTSSLSVQKKLKKLEEALTMSPAGDILSLISDNEETFK